MIRRFLKSLEEDGHLKELVRGSLAFASLRLVGAPLGYLFAVLIARIYGPSPLGMLALASTIMAVGSLFATLGMGNALLRFVAEHCARGEKATARAFYMKGVQLCTLASVVITAVVYFTAPHISEVVFKKPHLTPYIQVASLGLLPGVLFAINIETLRALKHIKRYTFMQSVAMHVLLMFFFLIGYYAFGYREVMLLILIGVFTSLVLFFVSTLLVWKEFSHIEPAPVTVSAGQMLSVSLPMLMTGALFMVMSWTDIIMLGMWRTDAEVGVYNIAMRLAMITSFPLAAINSIAAPKFAEFWGRQDMEGLKRIAQQSTRLIFWTSAPVLALYLLFPSFFMGIFGDEFRVGALALVILSVGQFVNAASGSVGYILQMTGKQNVLSNIVFGASLINILLNYILIPKFGIYGAATASCVAVVILNLLPLFIIKKKYGFFTINAKYMFGFLNKMRKKEV